MVSQARYIPPTVNNNYYSLIHAHKYLSIYFLSL